MRLWGRKVIVDVTRANGVGKRLEGLDVSFRVKMSTDSTPNKATITIYNPAPETMSIVQSPSSIVRVLAGYGDVPVQVFQGNPVREGVVEKLERADRVLTIEATDGGRAYSDARIAVSMAGPVQLADALSAAIGALGLPQAYVEAAPSTQLAGGFTFTGRASDALSRLAELAGARWSIRDGALQIVGRGRATSEPALVISASAGNLIGSPSRSDRGLELRAQLAPALRPGRAIRVEATIGAGDYLVEEVDHIGDSMGGPYESRIKATPLGSR